MSRAPWGIRVGQVLGLALGLAGPLPSCAGVGLPKLPSTAEIAEGLVPRSSGLTLSEAVAVSAGLMEAWATGTPSLVAAEGKSIDPGGRNGGYKGGRWEVTWHEMESERGFRVSLAADQRASGPIVLPPGTVDLGGKALDGLLDSPAAIQASGLGLGRITVLLSRNGDRPRYNLVAEWEPKFVVLDARTGQKLEP